MSDIITRLREISFIRGVKVRHLRHILQFQVLILVLYSIRNPSAPTNIVWRTDLILSMIVLLEGKILPSFLVPFSIMILVTLVVGRGFCGWICPLGFLQDLTFFAERRFLIPEKARLIKYALLLGGFLMLPFSGWTFLSWITPFSMFSRAIGLLWNSRQGLIGIILLLIVLGSTLFFGKRTWCRYVCPLGAILSMLSIRKPLQVGLNDERCIKCKICERSCSMGIIDIEGQMGLRWGSECILCLSCRDNCPENAINIRMHAP